MRSYSSVCAKEFYEYQPPAKVDSGDQPVAIAFNVKNHKISTNDTGVRVPFLQLGRCIPVRLFYFLIPVLQRADGVGILFVSLFNLRRIERLS